MRLFPLALALVACSPPLAPVGYYPSHPGMVYIEGDGVSRTGTLAERAFGSSSGVCDATHRYSVRADDISLDFWIVLADLSAMLATENDADAALRSRVTLPDGRNGVLANGTVSLAIDADGIMTFEMSGSRWCEVELGTIAICRDEDIMVSYDISVTGMREGTGCVLEADNNSVSTEGACISASSPEQCI